MENNHKYEGKSLSELRVEMYKVLKGSDKQSARQLVEALGKFQDSEEWNDLDQTGFNLLKNMPHEGEFNAIDVDNMAYLGDYDSIGANDVVQEFRTSVNKFFANSFATYSGPEYGDKMEGVLTVIDKPGSRDLSGRIGAEALGTTKPEDWKVPDPTQDKDSQQH